MVRGALFHRTTIGYSIWNRNFTPLLVSIIISILLALLLLLFILAYQHKDTGKKTRLNKQN